MRADNFGNFNKDCGIMELERVRQLMNFFAKSYGSQNCNLSREAGCGAVGYFMGAFDDPVDAVQACQSLALYCEKRLKALEFHARGLDLCAKESEDVAEGIYSDLVTSVRRG